MGEGSAAGMNPASNGVANKMSAAAMHHQGNKLVWIKRLMEDANFILAVQNQSVKDAAQVAVDLLVQPQHMRSGSHGLPGLYIVPAFKPNDRVRLKATASTSGAANDDDRPGLRSVGSRTSSAPIAEGRVVLVTAAVPGGKPASVRVKWSSGLEQDHSLHDIELIRHVELAEMAKNEAPFRGNSNSKLKVRISGNANGQTVKKQSITPRSREIIRRVKRELSELETALPWHMVDDSWKQRRNGWRSKLKTSEAACQLCQCLKELLAVLKVQRDMPDVLLRMTQEEFVGSLDEAAASKTSQASADLARLWDQVKTEVYAWMRIKEEKHQKRQQHVHLAHTLQAFEACRAHGLHAYLQVPINRILASASERSMLKLALLNEYAFCEAKLAALESGSSTTLMNGVTYEVDGLGGSYGGLPQCGRSMLEGVLHFDSDIDTDDDVGSEATDLADSYVLEEPPTSRPTVSGEGAPASATEGTLAGAAALSAEQETSAPMDVDT